VVKTVRSTDIRTMRGHDNCKGEYTYFGIEKELHKSLQNDFPVELENESTISLFFNVDGLPLYKGSSKQFWQILGKIYNRKHIPSCSGIFVIAIFCGSSKPASIEEYLHDFIVELSHLMEVMHLLGLM